MSDRTPDTIADLETADALLRRIRQTATDCRTSRGANAALALVRREIAEQRTRRLAELIGIQPVNIDIR